MLLAAAAKSFSSEPQHYNEEAEAEERRIHDTDDLPAAVPNLSVPSESLHSAPESGSCCPGGASHRLCFLAYDAEQKGPR